MALPHFPITKIPDTEPDAVPGLWNVTYEEIDENFSSVDSRLSGAETELAEATGEHPSLDDRLDSMEAVIEDINAATIAQRFTVYQRTMDIRDQLGNVQFSFEMFHEDYTQIEELEVAVISGVSGDDSLDVADVTNLAAGKLYTLRSADYSEEIKIIAKLSDTRVRLTENLTYNYDSTAKVKRTTCTLDTVNLTANGPGKYISKPLTFERTITCYVFFEGYAPTFYVSAAGDESFFEVSGTVERTGLKSYIIAAGEKVYRLDIAAGSKVTSIVWLDRGKAVDWAGQIEVENESGLFPFAFADYALPDAPDGYFVVTQPDADYRIAALNRRATGFDIQLYKPDGTPGAEVDVGLLYCGMTGVYCGSSYCGEEMLSANPIGPKVDVMIRFN